ncbi:hypothetical protein EV379_1263 [Microterricola gilva]|uniref:Uncharacterized protein n=1 Tax=Microterricola gilva TaxID=393267 RepID=A0A4Q8AKB7_9MICO|nr:hypothetical protein [Microterricola gilva]RZU64952.1 hypothetical protein EV379_1263 [Microterricola gilva]
MYATNHPDSTTWQERYDDAGTGVEIEETTDRYVLALSAAVVKYPAGHPEILRAMEAVRRHTNGRKTTRLS